MFFHDYYMVLDVIIIISSSTIFIERTNSNKLESEALLMLYS